MRQSKKKAKTKRRQKQKTKANLPALVTRDMLTRYVTRDMLATLRDEIEQIFNEANTAIANGQQEIQSLNRIHDAFRRTERRVEALQGNVHAMQGLLGIEELPRHSSIRTEPVPWSYFHVWIARINERIERLERRDE